MSAVNTLPCYSPAMAEIRFSIDSSQLEPFTGDGVERALFRALKRAGGDAIRAVRAEAKRGTRDRVRIRAGYLANTALPLAFPKGQELSDLAWRMDVSGREAPLGEYPARQTRAGVSVEVQRGRRTLVKSAFIARAKSGRKGVFLRPSKARYPMGHRLGLSVADSMSDGRIPTAALNRGAFVMGAAYERLLAMELAKLGR